MTADDIEQRIAELEEATRQLWRAIDELYAFHGRSSPRWAFDHRLDMAGRLKLLGLIPTRTKRALWSDDDIIKVNPPPDMRPQHRSY